MCVWVCVFACLHQNSVCLCNYGRNTCCKDAEQLVVFLKTIFARKKKNILFPLNHIVSEVLISGRESARHAKNATLNRLLHKLTSHLLYLLIVGVEC